MYHIVYHNLVEGNELFVVKMLSFSNRVKRNDKRLIYSNTLRQLIQSLGLVPLLQKDNKGKPFLVNHPQICISISHRDDYLFLGLSNRSIGVDIERFNPNLRLSKSYYLSNDELDVSWTDNDLLTIWCAKEALFKKIGGGAVQPEKDFLFVKESESIIFQDESYAIHSDSVEDYMIVWV